MKSLSRQLSLYYWAGEAEFHIDSVFKALDVEHYYLIRRLPLAEMLGKTPVELAEELIGITTNVDWRGQHRRPIMCGDIFCQGEQPWIYVRAKEFEACDPSLRGNTPVLPLQTWPNYAIVNLLANSIRKLLCK